jgi:maltose O-acetyltransferase
MVSSSLLHFANLTSAVLPQTRFFRLRRFIFGHAGIRVGNGARISGTAKVHYPNASIGEDAWVGAGVQIIPTGSAAVSIGANCDLGPEVMLVTGAHELGSAGRRAGRGTSSPISIGDGTWVGARALFLGGAAVGKGSVVAAGALVRDSFPDNVMLAGIPATIVKRLD